MLFDAVAILPGRAGFAVMPPAVDFLSDAFVHCKFIGWTEQATDLLTARGLSGVDDDALCLLDDATSVTRFVQACRALRRWPREETFLAGPALPLSQVT